MRHIRLRSREGERFPEDISLLVQGLAARGYFASRADIEWAWADYSEDSWCAGWMGVHSPDDVEHILDRFDL